MDKCTKNWLTGIVIAIGALVIISLAVMLFAGQPLLSSLRIVFGAVFVLFLPGFIISYIFFAKTSEVKETGSIDWIERIALSFALSIAIVPLVVFYLNLIGIKINLLNSFLTLLGIIIISGIILYWKRKR